MRFFRKQKPKEISLDEILLDASNLPSFNTNRMEGRIELPLSQRSTYSVAAMFLFIVAVFLFQLFKLQVIEGAEHAQLSKENSIAEALVIAERGAVYDRNGELLAWNELDDEGEYDFPLRAYTDREGLGQLIGYVSYPKKDSAGFYYRTEYLGRNGIEEAYDELLKGENGEQLVEMNALGEMISEHAVQPAVPGKELTLSLDAELSEVMYRLIATTTEANGFRSGAGAMMNIHTGEIVAMTSFPSYDPEVLADGDDAELIASYNSDERYPFLNKVIGGLYTPGSIVKPFLAYGALAEGFDPMTTIVSNGSLTVPNPYNPDKPAVFRDWRAHGRMTLRDAIAYSSNVYFFIVGGGGPPQSGYEHIDGLGIRKISEYMQLFGFADATGIELAGELSGTIPDPVWKLEVFDDDWRLGDTYNTSIGQFGFQTTPIEMLRAYAGIANDGVFVTPHLQKDSEGEQHDLFLDREALTVVQEGMRQTVIQNGGTARALERSDVAVAAKSGTAELGASKAHVNSWIAGYFPYEDPQYAFILMMEYGPRANMVGASSVMGKVFDWMAEHRPEYIRQNDE